MPASSFNSEVPARPRFDEHYVQEMFGQLAPTYDLFNQISSLGLDHWWRQALSRLVAPGSRVLDVGTGTGDTALMLVEKSCHVDGLDFSHDMIKAAMEKSKDKSLFHGCVGRAQELPYKDGLFDVVTSSFVLRNLYRLGFLKASFEESLRVLKPGGQIFFLDLTRPRSAFFRWGHQIYLKTLLSLVGKAVFGKRWPGQYLRTSIEEFPETSEVCELLRTVGYASVNFQPLSLGIAGIFTGVKI